MWHDERDQGHKILSSISGEIVKYKKVYLEPLIWRKCDKNVINGHIRLRCCYHFVLIFSRWIVFCVDILFLVYSKNVHFLMKYSSRPIIFVKFHFFTRIFKLILTRLKCIILKNKNYRIKTYYLKFYANIKFRFYKISNLY